MNIRFLEYNFLGLGFHLNELGDGSHVNKSCREQFRLEPARKVNYFPIIL